MERITAGKDGFKWQPVLPRTRCAAHVVRNYTRSEGIADCGAMTHLKVTIFPDGGLSRVRVRGRMLPVAPAKKARL